MDEHFLCHLSGRWQRSTTLFRSGTSPVNGEEADSFNAPLYDQHGDWSVKVLTDPVMIDGSRHYTDAVTFHITVP